MSNKGCDSFVLLILRFYDVINIKNKQIDVLVQQNNQSKIDKINPMQNSTISSKQHQKASLHSILYYNPVSQSPPKIPILQTVPPAQKAQFDQQGRLKQLKIILIGNPKQVKELFEEITVPEEGIHLAKIKGLENVAQVQVCYSEIAKSENSVVGFGSRLRGIKCGIVLVQINQQCITYIKENLHLWKQKFSQPLSLILYTVALGPSDTHPQSRPQSPLKFLSQILDLTITQNILLTQIPLIDDTISAIRNICLFRAAKQGNLTSYEKQKSRLQDLIKEGKIRVIQIGKLLGTFVVRVAEIWDQRVQIILKDFAQFVKLSNLMLEIMEEQQEYRSYKVQIIQNNQKIQQIRTIKSIKPQKSENNLTEVEGSFVSYSNRKSVTPVFEAQIEKLENIVQKIKKKNTVLENKCKERQAKKQENMQQITKKNKSVENEIKQIESIFNDFLKENQKSSTKNCQEEVERTNSFFDLKSMEQQSVRSSYIGNYQKSDQQVKQQILLKAKMQKQLNSIKKLIQITSNILSALQKEIHYNQLMLRMEEDNIATEKTVKLEETKGDPFLILAQYFVRQRLKQQQNKQYTKNYRKKQQIPNQTKNETQKQNIRNSMYEALLGNSTFPQANNEEANKKMNNAQKMRNNLHQAAQIIYNLKTEKFIQSLHGKQYVQYKLDVHIHNLTLLQKYWMKELRNKKKSSKNQ